MPCANICNEIGKYIFYMMKAFVVGGAGYNTLFSENRRNFIIRLSFRGVIFLHLNCDAVEHARENHKYFIKRMFLPNTPSKTNFAAALIRCSQPDKWTSLCNFVAQTNSAARADPPLVIEPAARRDRVHRPRPHKICTRRLGW